MSEQPPKEKPSEVQFKFSKVTEKPKRAYRKGSKYDPVLDAFLKSTEKLSSVIIEGKEPNYIRTQLNKRIEAKKRKYGKIEVSVVNNVVYLEKK